MARKMAKKMSTASSKRAKSKQVSQKSWAERVQSVWMFTRTVTVFTLIVAVFAGVLFLGFTGLNQPLQSVQLSAEFERVNTLDVEKVLANYQQEKFLSINLDQLQTELKNIAWVDRAEVRRRFPSTLQVILSEHVAAARWGDRGLLNTRGELILREARYLPPELPKLEGPEGSEWQVAQQYLELRKNVLAFGLHVQYLGMDARGAWRFDLSNGTQVHIGREATDQRFHRFSYRVLPLLFQLPQTASVIDMRYSNGFAVKWQKDGAPSTQDLPSDATGSGSSSAALWLKDFSVKNLFSQIGSHEMKRLKIDLSGDTTHV